jgi:hypothetical protein
MKCPVCRGLRYVKAHRRRRGWSRFEWCGECGGKGNNPMARKRRTKAHRGGSYSVYRKVGRHWKKMHGGDSKAGAEQVRYSTWQARGGQFVVRKDKRRAHKNPYAVYRKEHKRWTKMHTLPTKRLAKTQAKRLKHLLDYAWGTSHRYVVRKVKSPKIAAWWKEQKASVRRMAHKNPSLQAYGERFVFHGEVIRPGDRVTITKRGHKRTGRVVMSFPTHVVLNMGGPHGTPEVAGFANILSFRKGK